MPPGRKHILRRPGSGIKIRKTEEIPGTVPSEGAVPGIFVSAANGTGQKATIPPGTATTCSPVPKRVAAVPPVPDRVAVFPPHVHPRPRRSLKKPLFAPPAHERTQPRPMHLHPPAGLFNRKATVLDNRPPIRIAPPNRHPASPGISQDRRSGTETVRHRQKEKRGTAATPFLLSFFPSISLSFGR